jgi:hypothetical protein
MKNLEILLIAVGLLILFCLINNYGLGISINGLLENFEETPQNCPSNCIQPTKMWYEENPIRAIISLYSGIGINICPANAPNCDVGTINDDYIILIDTNNNDIPQGAMTVLSDGSFTTMIPNGNDKNQLWRIVDKGGFYKLVWKESLGTQHERVLQYENGSISVRLEGNYESQKWNISPEPILGKGIQIVDNNKYSHLSPEFKRPEVHNAYSSLTLEQLT